METLDLVRAVAGRWRVIAASVAVAIAAGGAVVAVTGAEPAPTVWRATAIVASTRPQEAARLAPVALLVTAGEVPARAWRALGSQGTPAELVRSITVEVDDAAAAVTVAADHTQPAVADARAAAFADTLVVVLRERSEARARDALEAARDEADRLEERIRALDARFARGGSDVVRARRDALVRSYSFAYERAQALAAQPVDAGVEVLRRTQPEPVDERGLLAPSGVAPRLALAGLLGLLLGCGIALVLERLDPRLRSAEQAARAFGFPVLAQAPARGAGLSVTTEPASAEANAYRLLRAAFTDVGGAVNGHRWLRSGRDGKTVVVTSAGSGEGKTLVAANLAAAFREAGYATAAISADLRTPTLHRMLQVPETPGLVQALNGTAALDALHRSPVAEVEAMPSGGTPANAAALLGSDAAARAIEAVRARQDAIVIDTSGLLDASDAAPLVPRADAVVVVARAGRTPVAAARRMGDVLRRMDAPVAGVFLFAGGGR